MSHPRMRRLRLTHERPIIVLYRQNAFIIRSTFLLRVKLPIDYYKIELRQYVVMVRFSIISNITFITSFRNCEHFNIFK